MPVRPGIVEGGCLCGAIRFRSSLPPLQGAYCHCRICRKLYGGLFMATLQFQASTLAFTQGSPSYHRSTPVGRRGFCGRCGTPLLLAYDQGEHYWVLLGALDDPEAWPLTADAGWGPVKHYHADAALAWAPIADGLPQLGSDMTPFRDAAEKKPDG